MNNQGYFLIGLGIRYIDECYNLALTIRKNNDNRPISLLVNKQDIEYCKSKNIFDKFIEYHQFDDDIWSKCQNYFEKYCLYPRLYLNRYTPYEETITVDSDVLCQYNTEDVWRYCRNRQFPVQMTGRKIDYKWHWGTIKEVMQAYNKHIPHVHGGFFYINKNNTKTEDFFLYARSLIPRYDELKCKRWYANGIVDEILFAITHSYYNLFPIEFDEFPIMTFNYECDLIVPSTLQTEGGQNVHMHSPIPFVHMFDKIEGHKYKCLLSKILQ